MQGEQNKLESRTTGNPIISIASDRSTITLPPELFFQVMESLDKPDLSKVMSVSQWFRALATPRMAREKLQADFHEFRKVIEVRKEVLKVCIVVRLQDHFKSEVNRTRQILEAYKYFFPFCFTSFAICQEKQGLT